MLPEHTFDPLLASFSLTQPKDSQGFAFWEAIPASGAQDGSERYFEPAIRLWHRAGGTVELSHLRGRLKTELRRIGHKTGDTTIGALLSLYTLHPDRLSHPTRTLKEFLSKTIDADVRQFFIHRHPYRTDSKASKLALSTWVASEFGTCATAQRSQGRTTSLDTKIV